MSSEVWSYFKIDEYNNKYAICNFCSKRISRGGTTAASKSTSNLMNHLKTHKIYLTQKGKSEKKDTVSSSGPSMLSFLQKSSRPTVCTQVSSDIHHETDQSENEQMQSQPLEHPEPSCSGTHHVVSYSNVGVSKTLAVPLEIELPAPNQGLFSLAQIDTSSDVDDPSGESSLSTTSISPRGPAYPKKIKLSKSKQQTLTSMTDKLQKFKPNDSRAIRLNNLIGEMICKDLQPISIVENEGFRKLINYLEPRYTIPARKTFTKKILVEMYQHTLKKVQAEVINIDHLSITTDMWTNISQTDFMAVTAHFVNEVGVREHRCLEVIPFPEVSHTAVNLRDFLVKVTENWNIKDKVVAVVRDNGPDITAALERSNFTPVPCVAHTLQLVVKDGFFSNPKIINVTVKAKKLVGSFKHSAKNTKLLKATQNRLGIPEHKMIQDEPTRWNSTFYMLRRLHEQKQAIILVGSNPEVKLAVEMTNDDWKTIEYGIEILQIFETATLQLSKENASISEIIPMVNTIQRVLETRAPAGSGLQGLKNDLLASLKRRYSNVEENLLFACATLLDPRFKTTPFSDVTKIELAKGKIVEELRSMYPTAVEEEITVEPGSNQEEQGAKCKTGFWHHYQQVFQQSRPTSPDHRNPVQAAEEELNSYLAEKTCVDPKSCEKIFSYWSATSFTKLQKIAFKYLSIPPCTVFSERLFSLAGNICEAKRNRLDPERVKMLVFLNKNIK